MAFRKSFRVGKGGRINVSKSGLGFSLGSKGTRLGVGPRGLYTSVGIPGTGIRSTRFYTGGKRVKGEQTPVTDADLRTGIIGCLGILSLVTSIVLAFAIPPVGIPLTIVVFFILRRWHNSPKQRSLRLLEKARDLADSDLEKALGTIREAWELEPENMMICRQAAYIAARAQQYNYAVEYVEHLRDNGEMTSDDSLLLGLAYYQLERYDDVISALQELPRDDEDGLSVVLLLAGAFSEKEEYAAALEVLKDGPTRKRKLDDQLLELHYQLGWHYEKLGQKGAARRHYQRVYAANVDYRDVSDRLKELDNNA